MTSSVLEKICDERDEVRSAAIAIAESAEFNPEDKTFVDLQSRAQELDKRVASLTSLMEQRQAADALDGKFAKANQQRQTQTHTQTQTREAESWGTSFVRSSAFTDYGRHGQSAKFEIDTVQERALPMKISEMFAAGLKGSVMSVDTTAPTPPTPLLDVMTKVQVQGSAIEYVAWAKAAGGAATVAEAAPKPSAEFRPTVTPATLELIAVWSSLTRQMLEDYTAVRDIVDQELRREVAREEEEHAAAAIVAADIPTAEGDDLLSAIRVGIGQVQSLGYSPSAVLLNPADYADLDISVMGATLLGPTIRANFWGLTPVPANSQPAGTATVGDFATATRFFYRSDIALFISDNVGSDFLSNVFTLLSERRSLSAVVRPQALVECSAAA